MAGFFFVFGVLLVIAAMTTQLFLSANLGFIKWPIGGAGAISLA